jgi:hypothetical protein
MIKQFNIPGLGVTAVLTIPAQGGMPPPRMSRTETKNTDNVPARFNSHLFGRNLVVLMVVALLSGGSWYFFQKYNPASVASLAAPLSKDYITNDQLEAQYGVRVTLIAVTAQGGIVDFRYKVSDPAKAAPLLHDPANTPVLTAVDSGLTLSGTQMSRHHRQKGMKRGAVPFTFYPNVRGAVKSGTPVSVAFGKIKVEPIVAQ